MNQVTKCNNIIFYCILGKDIDENQIYLSGDTFRIKSIFEKFGMVWDVINQAWVFKNKPKIEKEFERRVIDLFRRIEALGYMISPKFDNNIFVRGYEKQKI